MRHDLAAVFLHQFGSCLFAHAAAPATNVHIRAELEEAFGHFLAEARAAARDEDAFILHQAIAEHQL